jgi:nucleotide-binding universal stress UspA family protein
MSTFLVGTDSEATSERLIEYLKGRVGDDDSIVVVNSLHGGDRTSDKEVREGKDALDAIAEIFSGADTHQLVRGNSPQEDLLQYATEYDADEIVVGIRKRSPTGKLMFGSTAQDLLLSTERPVVCVPLTRGA